MKNNQEDFISGIGNTPLIKLRAASEITGIKIKNNSRIIFFIYIVKLLNKNIMIAENKVG